MSQCTCGAEGIGLHTSNCLVNRGLVNRGLYNNSCLRCGHWGHIEAQCQLDAQSGQAPSLSDPNFYAKLAAYQKQPRLDAEAERRRNHHEVMCLVLKEAYRARYTGHVEGDAVEIHADARYAADLAYPPPKSGDGWCRCNASPEPHIHQLVPDEPPKEQP